MKNRLILSCPQEAFEGIHDALDRTKRTSSTVKVDRAALQALLIDHAKLLQQVDHTEAQP